MIPPLGCSGRIRSQIHASAGNISTAPNRLVVNMNSSSSPMSTWNCSPENSQVAMLKISASEVNTEALPVWRSASR